MLNYNTSLKRLVLPEYGRNIQRMVDECLKIDDRDERTRCAYTIVATMGNLFPELRAPESEHKLWDHLMIMSDFKLDIDFPCEVVKEADLTTMPEHFGYSQSPIRMRHYGKLISRMIDQVLTLPEGQERESAIILLANHMKKQMLAVNPDGVEDARIFNDLAILSDGAIRLNPETTHLHEFSELPQPTKSKKKKKK